MREPPIRYWLLRAQSAGYNASFSGRGGDACVVVPLGLFELESWLWLASQRASLERSGRGEVAEAQLSGARFYSLYGRGPVPFRGPGEPDERFRAWQVIGHYVADTAPWSSEAPGLYWAENPMESVGMPLERRMLRADRQGWRITGEDRDGRSRYVSEAVAYSELLPVAVDLALTLDGEPLERLFARLVAWDEAAARKVVREMDPGVRATLDPSLLERMMGSPDAEERLAAIRAVGRRRWAPSGGLGAWPAGP